MGRDYGDEYFEDQSGVSAGLKTGTTEFKLPPDGKFNAQFVTRSSPLSDEPTCPDVQNRVVVAFGLVPANVVVDTAWYLYLATFSTPYTATCARYCCGDAQTARRHFHGEGRAFVVQGIFAGQVAEGRHLYSDDYTHS